MKRFLKQLTRREWFLWATALLLLIFMVGYTAMELSIIAMRLNESAFSIEDEGSLITRFDFATVADVLREKAGITVE